MRSAVLVIIVLVASTAPGSAQLNRHSVTQSYDAASPEIMPGGLATSDVMSCVYGAPPALVWPRATFSIPPAGNIDAVSDGTDVFPPGGPAGPAPPANGCRLLAVEFSVDRLSVGVPAAVVAGEAGAGGNGAAADVFRAVAPFLPPFVTKATDGMCTSPLPAQSNISDLAWVEKTRYPVYFSIGPGTSMTVAGQAVSPADVLVVTGPPASAPGFHVVGASIGLVPGDDIDAIAVDRTGRVAFSLSRSSPTAQNPVWAAVNSAGLFVTPPPPPLTGGFAAWATALNLALTPGTGGPAPDDLDGVRITDPALFSDGGAASGTGGPDALTIDGLEGSVPHRVYFPPATPATIAFAPGAPAPLGFLVFAFLGIPENGPPPGCGQDEFPLSLVGFAGGVSFVPPDIGIPSSSLLLASSGLGWPSASLFPPGSGPWLVPPVLPAGLEVSLQAIAIDGTAAPIGLRVSNMVTLVVD